MRKEFVRLRSLEEDNRSGKQESGKPGTLRTERKPSELWYKASVFYCGSLKRIIIMEAGRKMTKAES